MDFAPPTETPVEQNNILTFPTRARGGCEPNNDTWLLDKSSSVDTTNQFYLSGAIVQGGKYWTGGIWKSKLLSGWSPVVGRDDFGLFWNFTTGKQIPSCVTETWRYGYILGSGGRVETPRHTPLVGEKSLISIKKWSCEKWPTKVIFVRLLH